MKAASDDRAARAPVWLALSDLYLDRPYRSFVRAAVEALAQSPYTAGELRAILFDEVHPVVCANLCAPAGVWERFDQAWLARRVIAHERRPRWLRPCGRCTRRYATLLWRLLEPRIARTRIGSATSHVASTESS